MMEKIFSGHNVFLSIDSMNTEFIYKSICVLTPICKSRDRRVQILFSGLEGGGDAKHFIHLRVVYHPRPLPLERGGKCFYHIKEEEGNLSYAQIKEGGEGGRITPPLCTPQRRGKEQQ